MQENDAMSFAWPVTAENPEGRPLNLMHASGFVQGDAGPAALLVRQFGEQGPGYAPWVVSTEKTNWIGPVLS